MKNIVVLVSGGGTNLQALIDAQNGELERLKEFGITKAKILEQGEKMFTGVQLVNGQGQITNQEKFNEAMIALMQDRFAGGMGKQATTMKGLWSTVTGVTKSALANMVGITSDGSIRSGSDTLLCFRPLQRQLTDTVAIIDQMFAQCRKQGKYRSRAENPQQKIRRKAHNAKALPERLIHKEQQKNLRDHRNRRHLNAVDFETGAQVAPLLLDNKQENQLLHRPI